MTLASAAKSKASDYVSSSKDDDILKKGDGYKTSQNKINDIEALKADYIEKLNKFLMDQSTTNTPSISQKSQIDFSSNLSSLQATDNTISVTIDNKTYSVKFDVNSTINDEEMQKLYDFLDTNAISVMGRSVLPVMMANIANQIKQQWLDKI